MKKSLYKVVLFTISVVNLILLLLVCFDLEIISLNIDIQWIPAFKALISNDYFINVFCSVFSIVGLYIIQLKYCKVKLKQDFRCNEIIHDLYDAIERTYKLVDASKYTTAEIDARKEKNDLSFDDFQKFKAKKYFDFYSSHKADFDLCNLTLTYHNNKILIESVQTVFFINLNFKLLNIVNNIKNRKPNLDEEYPEIERLYEEYKKEPNDKILLDLGHEIRRYIVDIDFMAKYWYELLKYLGYDPAPIKFYIAIFNLKYPTDEERIKFFKLPISKQNQISRQIQRQAVREYIKYKIKNFFK